MSTEAQITANKANAQHSSGPKTPAGKQNSSQNNFRHGFCGEFTLLAHENREAFDVIQQRLIMEHGPLTQTEQLLVEKMAQHHWLAQRAIQCQRVTMESKPDNKEMEQSLALYLRYQIANERGFSKCLNDLLKLRAEKRKEQIGFESQKLKEQEQARKQSIENRKQELHKFHVWHAEAKAEHQELLNAGLETPETRMPNRMERLRTRQQAA